MKEDEIIEEVKSRVVQPYPETAEPFVIEPYKIYTYTVHYGMNTAPMIVEKKGKDLDAKELQLMYGDWLVRNGLR